MWTYPPSIKGFYSDASRMFTIGQISPERQRLVTVAKECLDAGLAAIRPWGFLGDVGAAIQEHAEATVTRWLPNLAVTAAAWSFTKSLLWPCGATGHRLPVGAGHDLYRRAYD